MKVWARSDRRMHGVQRVDGGQLWWWGYFRWLRRTYYLLGVPVWYCDTRHRELPITGLIKRACGG